MSQKPMLLLEQFLAYRVVRFADKLSHAVSDIYTDEHALTIAQWRVLATLAEHDGLTAKTIGIRTSMDKVKVSRAINSLEARRLLTRSTHKGDGRVRHLSLTDAGWRLYYKVVPKALVWQKTLVNDVSEKEYETFLRVMAKLEHSIDSTQGKS